ncbi:hypothetical protein Lser_V15G25414 [Lactuca serriola]
MATTGDGSAPVKEPEPDPVGGLSGQGFLKSRLLHVLSLPWSTKVAPPKHAPRQDSELFNNNAIISLPITSMASPQQPMTLEMLPDELLLNIFIRLSAKQLAQMSLASNFHQWHLKPTHLCKPSVITVAHFSYLISRPTVVNLSDAATKLTEIVMNSAATATDANQVFLAYIEAAEVTLEDDVASNKAIGSYGSSFIQIQQKESKKFFVLTHCNTDSLVIAGFGTALGVIRALHSDGVLERAYCTETRQFNQGSRLTAYEFVHDKIPATLIADSAAAALMKTRSIHAVIVGADRVTANRDIANKIGTYSLALSAKHHGVQFYVAVPLTLVDLSLSSGNEIVIEERSPKELLNTRGGMGEQVAASEICVWNPAFDVTPANLISRIITEKVAYNIGIVISIWDPIVMLLVREDALTFKRS